MQRVYRRGKMPSESVTQPVLRFVDLFCGIGGFRLAVEDAASRVGIPSRCVLSSDIDAGCRRTYQAHFGDVPSGDIRAIEAATVPEHDLLLAGFPCQPFSIIGDRKGFEDTRGTLFFDIARILEAKRPPAFVLENVKLLVGHRRGTTLGRILETLSELGYRVEYRVLNALDFGLPQKRERVFIVGSRADRAFDWPPGGLQMRPLAAILENGVAQRFYVSPRIRDRRWARRRPEAEPTIWHENKSGHVSAHPFSCALRAGASHNYLLVDGERRLTPREMLRLQGFPDSFHIVGSYNQAKRQTGNSLPVPVAQAVLEAVLGALLGTGETPLVADSSV